MAEPTIATEYVGGACDGQTRQVHAASLATGTINCDLDTYIVKPVTPTLYRATWEPLTRGDPAAAGLAAPADFNRAWTALMRTLAFRVPLELRRQAAALQRIRKAVR